MLRLAAPFLILPLLLPAPAAADPADLTSPGTRDLTLKSGKLKRAFRLHIPARADESPLPLVIALHGLFMTGPRLQEVTGFDAVADREGFAVAYPSGAGMRWRHSDAETDVDDVAFIRRLIDRLVRAGTADPRRVYVCGFSNGAFFANRLACELSDRIAAIGLVAGVLDRAMKEKLRPPRPMPVAYFHGTRDAVVAWDGKGPLGQGFLSAEQMAAWWAEKNGCVGEPVVKRLKDREEDGTRVERRVWAAGEKGAEVRFYVIEGGGHTWPGGGEIGPKALVGAISRDINASARLWAFFRRHALPETPAEGK